MEGSTIVRIFFILYISVNFCFCLYFLFYKIKIYFKERKTRMSSAGDGGSRSIKSESVDVTRTDGSLRLEVQIGSRSVLK